MTTLPGAERAPADKFQHIEQSLAAIRQALLALQYGSVSITVHQDRVVQIDVTEKKRLTAS